MDSYDSGFLIMDDDLFLLLAFSEEGENDQLNAEIAMQRLEDVD